MQTNYKGNSEDIIKYNFFLNNVLMFSVLIGVYRNVIGIVFGILLIIVLYYIERNIKLISKLFEVECFSFFLWVVMNEKFFFFENVHSRYIFILLTGIIIWKNPHYMLDEDSLIKKVCMDFWVDLGITICSFGPQIAFFYREYGFICGSALGVLFLKWSNMLCKILVSIFNLWRSKNMKRNSVKQLFRTFVINIGIILFLGFIMSIIYYPGIITSDCAGIYEFALNLNDPSHRTDIHSFAFTLIIALIVKIFHNYYAITLFMVIVFALCWAFCMVILNEYGMPLKATIALTLFWLSFPGNLYYLICSWKDMLFTSMLLLTSTLIMRFLKKENDIKKWPVVLMMLSTFSVATFRSNGQVVLIVMLLIVGLLFLIKRDVRYKRMLIAFGLAGFMLLIFKGPIFSILHVQKSPESLATLPFIDGIWENIYQDNEVGETVIKFIEEIMPVDDFRDAYDNRYTNYYAFPNGYQDISLRGAKDAYLLCLRDHPLTTLSARIKKTYNIWFVNPDKRFPSEWIFINHIAESDIIEGENWQFPECFQIFRELFSEIFTGSYIIGFIQQILCRSGSCLVICFILLQYLKRIEKREMFLAILPGIINLVGLAIGCCFNDYRYTYPMFVLTVPFVAACLYLDRNNQTEEECACIEK